MQLTRSETINGTLDEYDAFGDLLDGLSDDDWRAPTRCEGWEVRDVASHVVGAAEDVVGGVPGSRTPDEEAAALRDLSAREVAERLGKLTGQIRGMAAALDTDDAWAAPSGFNDLTVAEGILTLWYDTYLHADDIRSAIGRPRDEGQGLRATVAYLEDELNRRSWGPASIVFADRDESFGGLTAGPTDATAPTYRVPAYDFVLAATGRVDPEGIGLDPSVNIYAD